MKFLTNFFNWYFGKKKLPYWCIIIFDILLCFLSGFFVFWLRSYDIKAEEHLPLFSTFCAFAAINLIGFRLFHTYSGILRYSQFIDLLKVLYPFLSYWQRCSTSSSTKSDGTIISSSSRAA